MTRQQNIQTIPLIHRSHLMNPVYHRCQPKTGGGLVKFQAIQSEI
jgi:hypothetical protein